MLPKLIKCLILLSVLAGCAARRNACTLPIGIFKDVSSLRGLAIKNEVPCIQTQSVNELKEILSETIDKRLPRAEVELEGEILKLLGIIPKNYNYREEIISQYAFRLNAFYSPEFKRFVLARDLGREKKSVLAHELTHALQDQYYDLNGLTAVTVPSDTMLARTSIFEGDANIIMKKYTGENVCAGETMKEQIDRLEYIRKDKSDVPIFFELQMALPYLVGEQYLCNKINESRKVPGGGANQVLKSIYDELPISTAELLGNPRTTVTSIPKEGCLKADSYGLFGIVSVLAPDISIADSLKTLSSLKGDVICLTKSEVGKYQLSWEIQISNDAQRKKLTGMLSDYFSKHIPKSTYFVNQSDDGLKITVEE